MFRLLGSATLVLALSTAQACVDRNTMCGFPVLECSAGDWSRATIVSRLLRSASAGTRRTF